MSPDLLERMRPYAEVIVAAPGQVVVWEGAPQDSLYLLISGQVSATKTVRGEMESLLAELGPGAMFGELGAICPGPAAATVTAEERSVLWRFRKEGVAKILADNALLWSVLRALSAKVRGANARLGDAVAWSLDATALDPSA